MKTGENRFSSGWTQQTIPADVWGYDTGHVCHVTVFCQMMFMLIFTWIWLLLFHKSKNCQYSKGSAVQSDCRLTVGTRDAETSLLLPMFPSKFQGNTQCNMTCGWNLIPSVWLQKFTKLQDMGCQESLCDWWRTTASGESIAWCTISCQRIIGAILFEGTPQHICVLSYGLWNRWMM